MSNLDQIPFPDLPGGAWILKGLQDLAAGLHSREALALRIFSIRLREVGFPIERTRIAPGEVSAEATFYGALESAGEEDPYGCYNAMLQELLSFLNTVAAWQKGTAV